MILILSAMPEELEAVTRAVDEPRSRRSAGREVTSGKLCGHAVTVAFSRWGKVAAASTAAHLLTELKPSSVIFTGIAGALSDELAIGDHVFARALF
ncbi:MAG: 5'-methylthioadenosine/S-adenosylhomocysteine nucleosidase, partial [Gammaproteobacteria bacterium]